MIIFSEQHFQFGNAVWRSGSSQCTVKPASFEIKKLLAGRCSITHLSVWNSHPFRLDAIYATSIIHLLISSHLQDYSSSSIIPYLSFIFLLYECFIPPITAPLTSNQSMLSSNSSSTSPTTATLSPLIRHSPCWASLDGNGSSGGRMIRSVVCDSTYIPIIISWWNKRSQRRVVPNSSSGRRKVMYQQAFLSRWSGPTPSLPGCQNWL